jgi:CheY-like chemotaxis protein
VEKFRSGEYDVVLMDVQMPVMDGYTATRTIREWEREKGKRPTPILALTAHAFAEEEKKSFAAGCNAHLVKPIRKAALLEAIHGHSGRPQSDPPPRAAPAGKISVRAPEGIEEAIPLFLDITRTDVQSLAEALRAADYGKIRFIGHDLKGSGGGYGFDEITTIGRSIEEAAKRSDGEEIRRQMAALTDYLDRVEVIYE